MPNPTGNSAGKIVRFGVFAADLAAGELRKNGVRIRLQEQPFQVLALLLGRPAEVVTREELRQKLWPADTFVDFDHSLNTAVNKVREALGDSASSPRYVETLARRGYRFVATVERDPKKTPVACLATRAGRWKPASRTCCPPAESSPHSRAIWADPDDVSVLLHRSAISADRNRADNQLVFPGWGAFAIFVAVLVTAGVGIPLRFYLLSAVAFDHQRLGEKFRRIFLAVLVMDQLWAVAPFLLVHQIGFGAAFAATAALLYVPFSERTLVRMAYRNWRSNVGASVPLVREWQHFSGTISAMVCPSPATGAPPHTAVPLPCAGDPKVDFWNLAHERAVSPSETEAGVYLPGRRQVMHRIAS